MSVSKAVAEPTQPQKSKDECVGATPRLLHRVMLHPVVGQELNIAPTATRERHGVTGFRLLASQIDRNVHYAVAHITVIGEMQDPHRCFNFLITHEPQPI